MSVERQVIQINKRLEQFIKKVPVSERRKVYRKAARPMVKQARNNVPVRTGELKKSIKVFSLRRVMDALFVGPKLTKKRSENGKSVMPFYAHWVEYGFMNKRSGKRVAPVSYMRNAFTSTKDQVKAILEAELIKKYREVLRSVTSR